jgi:hypothetical protein
MNVDIPKLIRKIAVPKFSGRPEHWGDWRYRYVAALRSISNDTVAYLKSAVAKSRDTWTAEAITCEINAVNAIHHHLISGMPDNIVALIRGLPHWTYEEAKIPYDPKSEVPAPACVKHDLTDAPHPSHSWQVLLDRYEPKTAVHERTLHHQLFEIKMDDDGDFQEYVSQLDTLCARIQDMSEQPVDESRKLAALLSGLPPSAEHEVSTIEATRPKMTYSQAIAHLYNFFARAAGHKAEKEFKESITQGALAVRGHVDATNHVSTHSRQHKRRPCARCGSTRHTTKRCNKQSGAASQHTMNNGSLAAAAGFQRRQSNGNHGNFQRRDRDDDYDRSFCQL